MNYITKLKKKNACSDAILWTEDYPTFKGAWDKCQRPDWKPVIAGKRVDKKG